MSCPCLTEFFLVQYKPQRLVGASARTIGAYQTALARWSCFSGVPISEIDGSLLARFQCHLLESVGPATTNCYLRHIMAILRFAEDQGLLDRAPRWRRLREPRRVPLALTVQEFDTLLHTAEAEPGEIGGIPATGWWRSVLLADWESGLRMSAILSVRCVDVLFDSSGFYCQAEAQKDREGQWFPVSPTTLNAIRVIYSDDRELLWPRHVTVETIGRWLRRLLDKSGIYAPKGAGNRWHRIRRSTASYTKQLGGDATLALGHSSPSVTERYYDPRIVRVQRQTCVMPLPTSRQEPSSLPTQTDGGE